MNVISVVARLCAVVAVMGGRTGINRFNASTVDFEDVLRFFLSGFIDGFLPGLPFSLFSCRWYCVSSSLASSGNMSSSMSYVRRV